MANRFVGVVGIVLVALFASLTGCARPSAPDTAEEACAMNADWADGAAHPTRTAVIVHGDEVALASARAAVAAWNTAGAGAFEIGATRLPGTRLRDGVINLVVCEPGAEAINGAYKSVTMRDTMRPVIAVTAEVAANPAQLAHEIGHVLGAEHTDEPGGLMRSHAVRRGRSPEPTAADVAAVAEAE